MELVLPWRMSRFFLAMCSGCFAYKHVVYVLNMGIDGLFDVFGQWTHIKLLVTHIPGVVLKEIPSESGYHKNQPQDQPHKVFEGEKGMIRARCAWASPNLWTWCDHPSTSGGTAKMCSGDASNGELPGFMTANGSWSVVNKLHAWQLEDLKWWMNS